MKPNKKAGLVSLGIVMVVLAIMGGTAYVMSDGLNQITGMVSLTTSCTQALTSGDYEMVDNITCSGNVHGLDISGSDVNLDCKGFAIVGDGDGIGIFVGAITSDISNIKVENCVMDNFDEGMRLGTINGWVTNSNITNNTFQENNYGLVPRKVATHHVTGNRFYNSSIYGIYFDVIFVTNAFIFNNTFKNSAATEDINVLGTVTNTNVALNSFLEGPGPENDPSLNYCVEFDSGPYSNYYGNYYDDPAMTVGLSGCEGQEGNAKLGEPFAGDFSIKCGAEIQEDFDLTEALLNFTGGDTCPGTGLNITGSNTYLNCSGNEIKGQSATGQIGVDITGDYVQVKNCKISDFDTGIYVDSDNSNITQNNITSTTDIEVTSGAGNDIWFNSFLGGTVVDTDGDFCVEVNNGTIRDDFGNYYPTPITIGTNGCGAEPWNALLPGPYDGTLPLKCGVEILGNFALQGNLINTTGNPICSGNGLVVSNNNLEIDCQNNNIQGSNTAVGIDINTQSEINISNCHISNFTTGINLTDGDSINISYNHIYDNDYGIQANGDSDENTYRYNTFKAP